MSKNNFQVPPFDPGKHLSKPKFMYFWWSWHPCYPYWSKSCWGANTLEEAYDLILTNPHMNSMKMYHNKLIREGDGKFVEVADIPCQNPEVWDKYWQELKDKFDKEQK